MIQGLRKKKVLPNVEDRTLTIRPPRTANVVQVQWFECRKAESAISMTV